MHFALFAPLFSAAAAHAVYWFNKDKRQIHFIVLASKLQNVWRNITGLGLRTEPTWITTDYHPQTECASMLGCKNFWLGTSATQKDIKWWAKWVCVQNKETICTWTCYWTLSPDLLYLEIGHNSILLSRVSFLIYLKSKFQKSYALNFVPSTN